MVVVKKRRGMRGKSHSQVTIKKAFKIWMKCEKNCTETSRVMEAQHHKTIPVSTITRWRDKYDWDQRSSIVDNEVARLFRESGDPVLQQLAMDDVEMADTLRKISKITRLLWDNPRRYGLMPRTSKELIELTKYAREEREHILSRAEKTGGGGRPDSTSVTIYDQRKQMVKVGLESLDPAQRAQVLESLEKISTKRLKALASARKEALSDDEDED